MLTFYSDAPMKIFLLNIHRCHFGSKIFGLDSDGRKEISEWSFFWRSYTAFHHCRIKSKQSLVSFCTYYCKTF